MISNQKLSFNYLEDYMITDFLLLQLRDYILKYSI